MKKWCNENSPMVYFICHYRIAIYVIPFDMPLNSMQHVIEQSITMTACNVCIFQFSQEEFRFVPWISINTIELHNR